MTDPVAGPDRPRSDLDPAPAEAPVLGAVLAHAAVGVTVVDADGVFQQVNAAFVRFSGFSAAELIGQPSSRFSPPEDAPVTRAAVADLRAGRVRDVTVEKRFLCKDGEIRWIALALAALPTDHGNACLVGIVTDVTDRRRAETASAAQQAFLDAVLQSLSDGMVACDAEGRLTLFNRATREFHGLPETPVPAERWDTHYSRFRADGTTPLPIDEVPLVRALRGEVVRDAEMVIAPTSGQTRTLLASGQTIRGPDGTSLGAVVAMRDVSDRVRAETALRASAARLALIYNSASDLLFLFAVERDAAGAVTGYRCESANEACYELTGLVPTQVLGRTPEEIAPPAIAARDVAHYAVCVATGEVVRYEQPLDELTGPVTLEVTVTPVFDDTAQRVTHVLCAGRDVTARRRTEAALRDREVAARANEARFRTALDAMVDAFLVLRPVRGTGAQLDDFYVVEANQAAAVLSRTPLDALIGQALGALVPATRTSGLFDILRRVLATGKRYDGEYQTRDPRFGGAWLRLQVVRTGDELAVTSRDVTERKRGEAALRELALRDELTQVLNRRGFRELAAHAITDAARDGRVDAMLCLDLSDFKAINDTFGHAEGDRALRAVADMLRATTRDRDLVARLGGDEFAVYAHGLHGPGEAWRLAERIHAAFHAANVAAPERPYTLATGIGVAELAPEDDLDAVLARADAALYTDKASRRAAHSRGTTAA